MATLMDYARLANIVYTSTDGRHNIRTGPGANTIENWGWITGMAVDDSSVFSGGSFFSSGLQMRAFLHEKSGEVVIAFKGTKPSMVSDLTADLKIVLEGIPRQAYEALIHVGTWRTRLTGRKVTLVGHSLGGGIAQVVGASLDMRFVTFNAPGMWTNATGICNLKKLANTTKMGVNYIKWGDVVGNFGKHIGDTMRVASMGHSIVGFIEYLKSYGGKDRDPLA